MFCYVLKQSLQIWLKSDRGEIEVYLCPEDEVCSSAESSSEDEGKGESLSTEPPTTRYLGPEASKGM